mgnify:CR=1 FL=1
MKLKELKKQTWLKYTEEEVKAIILKLANKGLTAEKIGLIIKDQYGIPSVRIYGLKIKQVLGDKFQEPTIINLEKKVKKIEEHLKKNKPDKKAKRAVTITSAKLRKRKEYQKIRSL